MKRSRYITLTLLTGATLVVSGCNEDEPSFFKDNAACLQELNDATACADAQKDALAQHLQTAPKFTSREQCEQQFGAENCMEQPVSTDSTSANQQSSGGYFMPMMMGYMMGRMGGGLFGGNNSRYTSQPLYRDRNNNAFTGGANGGLAGRFSGNSFQSSSAISKASPSAIRRGGFGTSSRSVWS